MRDATQVRQRRQPSGARRDPIGPDWLRWTFPLGAALTAAVSLVVGALSLGLNSLDPHIVRLLITLSSVLLGLSAYAYIRHRRVTPGVVVSCLLAAVAAALYGRIPEHIYGLGLNAIVHRSLVGAVLLLSLGIPALGAALFYLLGATPRAEDVGHYPLLLVPVALVLVLYAALLGTLVERGASTLDWKVVTQPFQNYSTQQKVMVDGWPVWKSEEFNQPGMSNHILGTFLLVGLVSLISLPIGAGAGVLLAEYGSGWFARLVRVATTALRAMSVVILGMGARSLVLNSSGAFVTKLVRGFFMGPTGSIHEAQGSFLTAACALSVLVLPAIARATEMGCRSLPRQIKEGAWSLGASAGYTLLRVTLPWALPNIVTSLMLGCAEAAGSVAVIMLLAGRGQFGVGVLREVTSLSYLIFDAHYSVGMFGQLMKSHQYSAAFLLLVITLGFAAAALALRKVFSRRFRGA